MFWLTPSRFQLWPDTGNPRGRASPGHRADSAPLHRPYGRDRWCPKLLQTRSCTSGRGIAVVGHPLFRKLYEHKKREDWVVTTILVPLTNSVHPRLPPVENDTRIRFRKLLRYYSEVIQLR